MGASAKPDGDMQTDAAVQADIRKRFMDATESFISKVRDDPNVIAVIICGSLAYDKVWEKSDIDMTLVVRDQILKNNSYCIVEDGITINVNIIVRSAFKRGLEKMIGGSFMQSYFSKGKIVYSSDESLYEYFEDIRRIGSDDIAISAFNHASMLVFLHDKILKWLTIRKDPLYAQYYVILAAEAVADMELCLNGEPGSRESIQKAFVLNPELIAPFYRDAMSHHLDNDEIMAAVIRIERYLEKHLDILKKPAIEFMSDGGIKTVTLFAKHFHVEGAMMIGALDFLAEKGVIEKVSQTIRITPKSRQAVEEIGYLYISDPEAI